jgi:hypothetical protein
MYLPPKPHVNVGWSLISDPWPLIPFFLGLDPFAFDLAAHAEFAIGFLDQEVAFPAGRCYSSKKDENMPACVPSTSEHL